MLLIGGVMCIVLVAGMVCLHPPRCTPLHLQVIAPMHIPPIHIPPTHIPPTHTQVGVRDLAGILQGYAEAGAGTTTPNTQGPLPWEASTDVLMATFFKAKRADFMARAGISEDGGISWVAGLSWVAVVLHSSHLRHIFVCTTLPCIFTVIFVHPPLPQPPRRCTRTPTMSHA